MANDLIRLEAPPMSIAALKERSGHVQALIKDLMVEDVHYMVIPGTKNRSLTKQGSEMLLSAFHIAVEPVIEDKSDADAVRYTVRITGTHMGSGIVVGVGVGRCSSMEEKYKWRAAVCREEFEETPVERRRIKWGWDNQKGAIKVPQVRTNPEDLGNTVLKMAKKRAQADLCLTALAASDAFRPQPRPPKSDPPATTVREAARARPEPSQGQQGTPAGNFGGVPAGNRDPASQAQPAPERAAVWLASPAQIQFLRKKLDQAGVAETHFLGHFELGDFAELPFSQVDHCLAWIASQNQGPPG